MKHEHFITVWAGIPSCSNEDHEFAIRHKLNFVYIYDAEKSHILNSDQVCNMTYYELNG